MTNERPAQTLPTVLRSPRRFVLATLCLGAFALIAGLLGYAIASRMQGTIYLAAPICLVFLALAGVRALRSRVEVAALGARYVGLVRTRAWTWADVRFVGRQSSYAFGSTGGTPEVLFRGGRTLVLVGLSDPKHPDAELAQIRLMQDALASYKATHPTAAEQLVALLRDEASGAETETGAAAEGETAS